MHPGTFKLAHGKSTLCGDRYKTKCGALVLHGAGQSSRERFTRLRCALNKSGLPSASFDFIGHGETGEALLGSTLKDRTDQAVSVIRHTCKEPLTLIAASMGGYTAIKLTEIFAVTNLILLVPAVYTPGAYTCPFGPEFSSTIRIPDSWHDSDAFSILGRFRGNLLIIAAESDDVIPDEVIGQIYASSKKANSRKLHIVPGSGHTSLFPKVRDFIVAMDMITKVCRGQIEQGQN